MDRVDLYRTGEADYVRVVDYKTGQREFRLSEVLEGINLQMLIYLLSLWQNGEERYGRVTPAGVLYLPAKLPVVRLSRDADAAALEREQLLTMKMNGLILDDPEIVQAMEADAAGLFIPARLDKKTGPAGGRGERGLPAPVRPAEAENPEDLVLYGRNPSPGRCGSPAGGRSGRRLRILRLPRRLRARAGRSRPRHRPPGRGAGPCRNWKRKPRKRRGFPMADIRLYNLCLIENPETRQVVALDKVSSPFAGITLPGDKVEKGESIAASVIREVREETG